MWFEGDNIVVKDDRKIVQDDLDMVTEEVITDAMEMATNDLVTEEIVTEKVLLDDEVTEEIIENIELSFRNEFEAHCRDNVHEDGKCSKVNVYDDAEADVIDIGNEVSNNLKEIEDFCGKHSIPKRKYKWDGTETGKIKRVKRKIGERFGWTEKEEEDNEGIMVFFKNIFILRLNQHKYSLNI